MDDYSDHSTSDFIKVVRRSDTLSQDDAQACAARLIDHIQHFVFDDPATVEMLEQLARHWREPKRVIHLTTIASTPPTAEGRLHGLFAVPTPPSATPTTGVQLQRQRVIACVAHANLDDLDILENVAHQLERRRAPHERRA